jgi:FkbM family methyltransferase
MNFNILIENNLEISSVLDIGAHAGTFTFECKKYYPNAYYYMIDGNPITEDYIKHSGVDYKITYLSDIVKKTVVYKTKYNAFNTGDSLFRENTNYYNDENLITQDITTSTLDELFKNEKVFDFIKIDAQGYEKFVLEGASNLIKKYKPTIVIEIEDHQLRKFGYKCDELFNMIYSMGYVIYFLDYHYPSDHVCVHKDKLEEFVMKNKEWISPLSSSNNLNWNKENGVVEKITF